MKINKEKTIIFSFLAVSILSFFAFGLFHLAQFETTDEHLWKYGRIKQYWEAIKNKEWEKTYINDKPGVTVALVSGFGLLSEPNPENKELLATSSSIFEKYDTIEAERINFAFRLPILIFSTFSLFLFFWLTLKAFDSYQIALFTTMLIAFNPILLGISQIINPDSFFWIFGGLSMLSYLAFIKNRKRSFLIFCGILTGFALLSKYTSFMLFLFYGLASISKIIFQKHEDASRTNWKYLWIIIRDIIAIFAISVAIFSIFLPATLLNPELLFKGISQFLNVKSIAALFILVSFLVLFATYKRNLVGKITEKVTKKKHFLAIIIFVLFSSLLGLSFVNTWTGQKIARVQELRDTAYANEPKEFNFKPLIDKKTNIIAKNSELYLMESYPFVFSLSPLLILFVFILTFKSFKYKISDENLAAIIPILSFTLLYFASTIFAGIITNVRYSILLYPIFALLGALALNQFNDWIKIKKESFLLIFTTIIALTGFYNLYSLRPFYFSYANFLLPEKFSIHDSWGHGSYEAAQYLNSLPNSNDLIIWSNTDTVCRFFNGKCLRSRKIDLEKVNPDYFVISKRGELKLSNRFILTNNPNSEKDSDYYFEKLRSNFQWQLLIDNRPDNYIKIIKFER